MTNVEELLNLITIPILPILITSIGLLWTIFPPQNRNVAFGYRSYMSLKNNTTWRFAHSYIAKIWTWVGLALLILHIILIYLFNEKYSNISRWIIFIEVAIMLLTILPTEIALIRKFDGSGKLK